ncbi:MAG: hypothetical protein EOO11_16570 [Chitinophagaceae bacterium]|nr:MAG: hypothetical protein EOO11_16570 [Chitinophagaceae bacterium]
MKRSFLALGLLSLLFACKKTNDDDNNGNGNTPAGPALNAADVQRDYAAGKTTYYYTVSGNGGGVLSVPGAGTGGNWNFAALNAGAADADTVVLAAANGAFPNSTYSSVTTRTYGGGGSTQDISLHSFGEVSASGWRQVGRSLPAFTLAYPGVGTLTYAAQNALFAPAALPLTPPFPVHLNDSVNFNTAVTENATADAPGAGLSNAPTAQRTTYSGKAKAIATGSISLPGYAAPMNAMVIRRDLTTVDNYFLNGAPASPLLLGALGLTDGETYSATYYDFYNYGGVGYLGSIVVQGGSIAYGRFRKAN